jgi:phage/plasmid-like protein (TIGR03299 family)
MLHKFESEIVDMADGLERFDGQAAFVSVRESAWHLLGRVLAEPAKSTAEFMEYAFLNNWNVRTEPLIAMVNGVEVPIPDKFAVVRDRPVTGGIDGLAVVGNKYEVVQNEDVFGFGEAILASSDAEWHTAGSIRDGRVVFGSMKLGDDILIGGRDVVGKYLLVTSSHDGSSGVTAAVTPIRVVCQNTLRLALSNSKTHFKARHTASVTSRVADAQKALNLTYKWFDEFTAAANRKVDTTVTDAQFAAIIDSVWDKPELDEDDSRNSLTRWENRRETLFDIWNGRGEDGDSMQGIGGTAWGALNTITEYLDWYGGHDSTRLERAGGLSDLADNGRTKAYKAVMAAMA